MVDNKYGLSPWYVTTDESQLRRFGKTLEELGELQAVLARCIIQGIDEVDPSSGKVNRQRLQEEIADVYAQTVLLIERFGLDQDFIYDRAIDKQEQMKVWELLVKQEDIISQDSGVATKNKE